MRLARPRLTIGKDTRIEPSKRMINELDTHEVKYLILAGVLSKHTIEAEGYRLLFGGSPFFAIAFELGVEHQLALVHNVDQVRCTACLLARIERTTSDNDLEITTLPFRHAVPPRRRRIGDGGSW